MTLITGRVWKYGDDVNTDVIFPGKYTYTISQPAEMPAARAGRSRPALCQGGAAG